MGPSADRRDTPFLTTILPPVTDSNDAQIPRSSASHVFDADSYRTLLERSREITYRVTTESGLMHGKVAFVNHRTEELTGHAARDFVDHPSLWASLLHPDDLPGVFATTAQMAESRTPVIREYRIKGADGQYHWMEDRVAPLVDATGRLIGYEGAAFDVTELKAAYAEADAARERLHAVLRTGHLAYWEWNLADQQVHYPAEWCQQLGLGDAERVAGIALWQSHVHPDDRHRILGALHRALEGPGSRFSSVYRLRAADGVELQVIGNWSVVRAPSGEPSSVLAVEIDVTDHTSVMR